MSTTPNAPQHPASSSSATGPRADGRRSDAAHRSAGGVAPARRRVPRWTVPFAAAAVAAAVWLVGAASGVDPEVRSGTGTQPVGIVAVIVTALVLGFVAWGVRALLGRLLSRRPGRAELAWLVTCGVVLLVSLLGPLGGLTPGAVAVLAAEHLAVGTTLALTLRH